MKRLLFIGFFCFLAFFGFSANAAPIQIAPGQELLLKGDDWVTRGTLPTVARSAGRLVPWVGVAITFGPEIYRGVQMLSADGMTWRQALGAVDPLLFDPLAPPAPAPVTPTNDPTKTGFAGNSISVGTYNSSGELCAAILTYRRNLGTYTYDSCGAVQQTATSGYCSFNRTSGTGSPTGCVVNDLYHNSETTTLKCPEGFMLSGLTCTYQYPVPVTREHIEDGKCDMPYPLDKDCARYPSGAQTFYGTDADGPFTIDITPGGSSGQGQIKRRVQTRDPSGNTQVETDTLTFGSDGKLISGTHTTQQRTELPLPTQTNPQPLPVAVDPLNPPNPVDVAFPNDYAKDETLRLVNTSILTATATMTAESQKIQDAINSLKDAPASVAVPDILNPQKGSFNLIKNNGMFDLLKGTTFANAGQCPTSSFDWNGHTFLFNQHCPLIENSWPIFQPVMIAIWLLLGVFIILRA